MPAIDFVCYIFLCQNAQTLVRGRRGSKPIVSVRILSVNTTWGECPALDNVQSFVVVLHWRTNFCTFGNQLFTSFEDLFAAYPKLFHYVLSFLWQWFDTEKHFFPLRIIYNSLILKKNLPCVICVKLLRFLFVCLPVENKAFVVLESCDNVQIERSIFE